MPDQLLFNTTKFRNMLDDINGNHPDDYQLDFCLGRIDGDAYEAYQPETTLELNKFLIDRYNDVFVTEISSKDSIDFDLQKPFDVSGNPQEDYVQVGNLSFFEEGDHNLNKLFEDASSQLDGLKMQYIKFYVIRIKQKEHLTYFIHQFSRGAYLTGNSKLVVTGDKLKPGTPEDAIAFKSLPDLVVFDGKVLIIHRNVLQRIFDMGEIINARVAAAIQRITELDIISNPSSLTSAALGTNKPLKKFASKLLDHRKGESHSKIDEFANARAKSPQAFIENFNVLKTDANLTVDIDEDGKLTCPSEELLPQFFAVLADAYYKTFMLQHVDSDIK